MRRALLCLSIIIAASASNSMAFAQEVRVVKKPLPPGGKYDEWTVSYSRKHGPDVFELDSIQSSEAGANKRVAALRTWSNSMSSDTDWRLAVILIEVSGTASGKDNAKDASDSKDTPDLKLPKLKLKPNRKPGDVLKEYTKAVQTAYQNAKEARRYLTTTTTRIAEAQFRSMNNTIKEFNEIRTEAIAETKTPFNEYPAISQVPQTETKAPIVREITIPKLEWVDVTSSFSKSEPAGESKSGTLAGKRGEGNLGKYRLTVDFTDGGTFQVTDPDAGGKQVTSGKWLQSGNEVVLTSETFLYVGTLSDQSVEGIRMPTTGQRLGSTEEGWKLKLKPIPPTPTIAGKWVAKSGELLKTYDINENGTLYLFIKSPYFGQGKNGSWSQKGAEVSAKFVDSGAPGTGGFSRGRDIKVRIVSADKIEIDGDVATRSR